MADQTKIEWADATWNPITGCTPVSEGCANCYAKTMAETRLRGRCGYPEDDPFRPGVAHKGQWDKPLHWKKAKRIFVCSMGDLFHEAVMGEHLKATENPSPDVLPTPLMKIFGIMNQNPQHTFMLLTKRPENALRFCGSIGIMPTYRIGNPTYALGTPSGEIWPENVWAGVTAENQARANQRIPDLLKIPAAKHFLSIEPMLGPVDLTKIIKDSEPREFDSLKRWNVSGLSVGLDWVIVGGETGPGARPMDPDWARSVRDQCHAAGVPFFMKKMSGGGLPPDDLLIREFPK